MTAFSNQLTSVVAGNSATTTAEFIVPSDLPNVSSGYINFDLLDANGVVYATGLATNYTATLIQNGSQITAQCNIAVPSTIPTTVIGTQYQLRLTLTLPDEDNQQFYIFSSIAVMPIVAVDLGAQDTVELVNSNVLMFLTLNQIYTNVSASIYSNNSLIATPITAGSPIATSDGYSYSVPISTLSYQLAASLSPYNVLWQYSNVSGPQYSEAASMYIVTPSIMVAIKDIVTMINKARGHFGYQPIFNDVEVLTFLRAGMDLFNGQFNPTNFNMTNAQGPIRYLWIACASIVALRSQYMMEGETQFNYSGSSVSLDVDRSQYYEGLASSIESSIQDPMQKLKINLAKRGLLSGDGSVSPLALNYGAIGALGITASPVSNLRATNVSMWLLGGSGPP